MIWHLVMWRGVDEKERESGVVSLLEDSAVLSYMFRSQEMELSHRRMSWFFVAFGGIWGLLLSLFMELRVESRASCMIGKHSTLNYILAFSSFLSVMHLTYGPNSTRAIDLGSHLG